MGRAGAACSVRSPGPSHPPCAPSPLLLITPQLVEQYAEEAGVEFRPKPGRMHEGLQVYAFGLVSCVIDNAQSALRAQLGGAWATASLEQLLEEHQRRMAARAKGAR